MRHEGEEGKDEGGQSAHSMPHAALQLAINTPPLAINVIGTRILASAGLNVEILRQKFLRLRLLLILKLISPWRTQMDSGL